jgi:hypothetical protein
MARSFFFLISNVKTMARSYRVNLKIAVEISKTLQSTLVDDPLIPKTQW